jgi:hypothetical protein
LKQLANLGACVPEERWAGLFAEAAGELLRLVLARPTVATILAGALEPMLLHEAIDPNLRRALLLARVETPTQFHHRVALGELHA